MCFCSRFVAEREQNGRVGSSPVFWQVKISGHVKLGLAFKYDLLNTEVFTIDNAGHPGVQRRFRRQVPDVCQHLPPCARPSFFDLQRAVWLGAPIEVARGLIHEVLIEHLGKVTKFPDCAGEVQFPYGLCDRRLKQQKRREKRAH